MPRVTVLMSVYNGERFLWEAIDSILSQTFNDFEFVIVDDGSTDGTSTLLAAEHDPRIRIVRNDKNLGLQRSLNIGLELACGHYVARLDADDIAMPDRLEKQVCFLDNHPEIGILGTACRLINVNGQHLGVSQYPLGDVQIRWRSLLTNPFAHPTVMVHREVLTQHGLRYNHDLHATEDYDLWTRVLKFTRGANLSEPLIKRRVHQGSLCITTLEATLEVFSAIALRTVREQLPGFAITPEQVSQLQALLWGGSDKFITSSSSERVALVELYLDMLTAFIDRHSGEPDLRLLQRQEALSVARVVFRHPLQPGWRRVVGRLITMHPGLPWAFLGYLSNAIARRLKRRALDILRQ